MKVTFQLTLDGLVRALKTKAHELAEDIEMHDREEPGEIAAEIRRIRNGERRAAHVGGD